MTVLSWWRQASPVGLGLVVTGGGFLLAAVMPWLPVNAPAWATAGGAVLTLGAWLLYRGCGRQVELLDQADQLAHEVVGGFERLLGLAIEVNRARGPADVKNKQSRLREAMGDFYHRHEQLDRKAMRLSAWIADSAVASAVASIRENLEEWNRIVGADQATGRLYLGQAPPEQYLPGFREHAETVRQSYLQVGVYQPERVVGG